MNKRLIVFLVINMLIITGSLVVGFYSYNRAQRYIAHDVIFLAPLLNESHLHFTMADVERLDRNLPNMTVVYESRGSAYVVASYESAVTSVIYTDASYFVVHALDFIEGGYWRGTGANAIVLNQALAWRLFGSIENIAGVPVWIGESVFIVYGVVWQNNESRYMAWMPRDIAPPDLPVTALYIHSNQHNPLAVYLVRNEIMFTRRLRDYSLVDINRFVESMGIRSRILLYTIWVCILVFLARLVWQRAAIGGKKAIKHLVLPVIGIGAIVYILWDINNILMWLPNLSNQHTSVLESISSVGLLPPEGYLPYGLMRLGRLSRYVNFAFIAGMVGLVNLLFCMRFKNHDEESD